jgi:hypothetical protein
VCPTAVVTTVNNYVTELVTVTVTASASITTTVTLPPVNVPHPPASEDHSSWSVSQPGEGPSTPSGTGPVGTAPSGSFTPPSPTGDVPVGAASGLTVSLFGVVAAVALQQILAL